MMCSAYFGELSEERKANWNHKEENRLLDVGNKYFHDRIQVDWGSFAWKCNPEEIIRFLNDDKNTLPWLIEDEEEVIEKVKTYISERGNVAYGVVFVEEA